jgi:1-aminocyclopropane-1-carboxylate deaminase/D-cysteine desulfhydrase-like pyridoxal-dependent ACC family enzyme
MLHSDNNDSGVANRERARRALAGLPRVPLAIAPTPLEPAPRLSARLDGPPILVKRDDLTGLALGGNKVRMLEYVLGKAVATGSNTVIGGSAAQSNYSRVLAGACARLGLECHLVLRRIRGAHDDTPQGSLLLDLLFGAHVHLVEDDRDLQVETLVALGERLERAGRRVYRALQASEVDKTLHALAYVEAAFELLDQVDALGADVARIYICSLDTSHAGLILGLRAAGSPIEVIGVSPYEGPFWTDRTAEDEVARLANETAEILGLDTRIAAAEVTTTFDFAGRYGELTENGLRALRLFGAAEGLVLDPVYTMKAAAAMIAAVEGTGDGRPVVFWHTGGTPALFAYAGELGVGGSARRLGD